MCVTAQLPLPECAKEHSSKASDEHNMHDERSHRSRCVLPLDCPYPSVPKNTQAGTVTNTTCTTKDHTARHVCLTARLPLPECAKEHSSRDSDEHNMHDERSHRPPCVSTAHCSHRSVPKNTPCTKEHPSENSDEHTMTTKRSHRPPCIREDEMPAQRSVGDTEKYETNIKLPAAFRSADVAEPVAVRSADVEELGAVCPADVVAVEELAVEAGTASLLVAVHVVVVHFRMSSVGSFVVTITE
ncbi:hypothetical protein Bbelb_082820 [Branchiostoma belcheri]|nr:hypothetical protein Bbelb_082820 [Branchiostoma belcheri]